MDEAESVNNQVLDLEDMQFKADDLKTFTNRNAASDATHAPVKMNKN